MNARRTLIALGFAALGALPAPAQDAAPWGFTSGAQAEAYLKQNPAGARAEEAFRTIVNASIAAREPGFGPAEIAAGSALAITPGATVTPEQIEAVINAATPGIGARSGFGLF